MVPDLNALNKDQRMQYLYDMTVIGDALLEVTGAYRINYEILGNTDPALHAHIIPRYLQEPDERRIAPAFFYDKADRDSIVFDFERDKALMDELARSIQRRFA